MGNAGGGGGWGAGMLGGGSEVPNSVLISFSSLKCCLFLLYFYCYYPIYGQKQ